MSIMEWSSKQSRRVSSQCQRCPAGFCHAISDISAKALLLEDRSTSVNRHKQGNGEVWTKFQIETSLSVPVQSSRAKLIALKCSKGI